MILSQKQSLINVILCLCINCLIFIPIFFKSNNQKNKEETFLKFYYVKYLNQSYLNVIVKISLSFYLATNTKVLIKSKTDIIKVYNSYTSNSMYVYFKNSVSKNFYINIEIIQTIRQIKTFSSLVKRCYCWLKKSALNC